MSNINFMATTYNNHSIVKYIEVWAAYSPVNLEGFINTPWDLLNKSDALDGYISFDCTLPAPVMQDTTMENQYMFIKTRAYSPIMRSEFSSTQGKILPPTAPITPTAVFNTFYYSMGGDGINVIDWVNKSGSDTSIEVWGKWGHGDWQLLDTVSQAYGHANYGHNIGTHPTGTYHYKLRATNDSGHSAYTAEFTCDTIAPAAPSNLGLSLNLSNPADYIVNLAWTNGDDYSSVEIWKKVNSGGTYALLTTLTTIGSTATSYADHLGIVAVAEVLYYKVRGVK